MKKGINYWAFPPGSDGSPIDPVEAMKRAKKLGFDCFEHTVEATGLISRTTIREQAVAVRSEADRIGIELLTVCSGLAWSESPTHPDPAVRRSAVETNLKMLELCSWLGVHTLLYVPGMVSAEFVPDFPPQPYVEVERRARESIEMLVQTAERLKVTVAVENVWNRFLLSPVEMRDFVDSFGSDYVKCYFDVGNCISYGHPTDWIRTLGARIAAVHMKDFKVSIGNLDGFVDLLAGDADYPKVMAAFREIDYDGPYTAEILPGRDGSAEKAIAALRVVEAY
ncbi:MAG TPA: sugar phosphate isomerase/epimerase family protein [Spirochaetia bacterium]|nr:sugar phosphate isomerase/epimerase family protein [Spirochaetia bacterium]